MLAKYVFFGVPLDLILIMAVFGFVLLFIAWRGIRSQ